MCVVCVAVPIVAFFEPLENDAEKNRTVIRIWSVDTFEGGRSSRAAFLQSVGNRLHKADGRIFCVVSQMSVEGAKAELLKGNKPDVISYGIGLTLSPEWLLPLPYEFAPAAVYNGVRAVPWARGQYAIYSKTEDFSAVSPLNTVVNAGRCNLPALALAAEGYVGSYASLPPASAYTAFLNGKYDYLVGTQRDAYRFITRNATVYCRPLTEYCDLLQYVSVFTGENSAAALDFVELLLSQSVQSNLHALGLASVFYSVESENATLSVLYSDLPQSAPSVFLSESAYFELQHEAAQGLTDAENFRKKLKMYLQPIEIKV